jgi:hypothetical protein
MNEFGRARISRSTVISTTYVSIYYDGVAFSAK